jgi:hypothetical protein
MPIPVTTTRGRSPYNCDDDADEVVAAVLSAVRVAAPTTKE